MLDRAISEAAQASAVALSSKNRFLNSFAVIPDMCRGVFTPECISIHRRIIFHLHLHQNSCRLMIVNLGWHEQCLKAQRKMHSFSHLDRGSLRVSRFLQCSNFSISRCEQALNDVVVGQFERYSPWSLRNLAPVVTSRIERRWAEVSAESLPNSTMNCTSWMKSTHIFRTESKSADATISNALPCWKIKPFTVVLLMKVIVTSESGLENVKTSGSGASTFSLPC